VEESHRNAAFHQIREHRKKRHETTTAFNVKVFEIRSYDPKVAFCGGNQFLNDAVVDGFIEKKFGHGVDAIPAKSPTSCENGLFRKFSENR
jgi:hypothetical protein